MKKSISFFLFSTFFILNVIAQDLYLANQYANPIYLNPAYSGGSAGPALYMNYRNQWPGISGSYTYFQTTIDIPVDKIGGGFAVLFLNETNGRGLINLNSYGLSYAHSFLISENFTVRAGFQGDYIRKSINWEKSTFHLPFYYDPEAMDNVSMFDFTGGVLASGKNFNAGFSVRHISEPNQSLYVSGYAPLPRKYMVHGSRTFTSGKFNFSPFLLLMKQQQISQISAGCYINRGLFSVGAAFESSDIFIFSGSIKSKKFRFGYSYDTNISKLGVQTLNSHEVYLIGILPSKKERQKLQPANLPVF